MKIQSVRLRGIRCFEDTGTVALSTGCNIFVGQNNAGKSTLLKGIMAWQLPGFEMPADARPGAGIVLDELVLSHVSDTDFLRVRPANSADIRFVRLLKGADQYGSKIPTQTIGNNEPLFASEWPNNFIVPFVAKRKASGYDQNVNLSSQSSMDGTFLRLYARIDMVASPGHSGHEIYRRAVEEIVGVFIGTRSSPNGKEAGYYFNDSNFVTLDRMGDGVSEMVALIVELSLARNKVFVLEEPETNLHPKGLKALLELVRESSARNQFIVATHSNVVVRELAADEEAKVFRVYRDGDQPNSPSLVQEVERTPSAHMELLRELGYEFGDFDLHEGWLFLEESSAETIVRDVLIPWFVPELRGRLRTFSAGGVSNLEPTVAEFQRLITFVHLDPVYRDRMWLRADGDEPGLAMIESIQAKFPYLSSPKASAFSKPQFELFYPSRFFEDASAALAIRDKQGRRAAKRELLTKVMEWTLANADEARAEWESSAAEQIELLREIRSSLVGKRRRRNAGSAPTSP